MFLAQLEVPIEAVREGARVARAAGVTVILNAAPAREGVHDLLSLVDVLIVNEQELSAISRVPLDTARTYEDALELVRALCPTVITTLGSRGVVVAADSCTDVVAPVPASEVDSTGAGDAFCAGFVAGLVNRLGLLQAVELGALSGALCVAQVGARFDRRTIDELRAELDRKRGRR